MSNSLRINHQYGNYKAFLQRQGASAPLPHAASALY